MLITVIILIYAVAGTAWGTYLWHKGGGWKWEGETRDVVPVLCGITWPASVPIGVTILVTTRMLNRPPPKVEVPQARVVKL